MTTIEEAQIVDGPSREELFDALRLRNEHRELTFVVLQKWARGSTKVDGRKIRLRVLINEIAAEDGSGHSWCLKVRIVASPEDGSILDNHEVVDFYYYDRGRNGMVIDARPSSGRPTIDRKGGIWSGGRKVGSLT